MESWNLCTQLTDEIIIVGNLHFFSHPKHISLVLVVALYQHFTGFPSTLPPTALPLPYLGAAALILLLLDPLIHYRYARACVLSATISQCRKRLRATMAVCKRLAHSYL